METITVRSGYHIQNGLKECKKVLDYFYKKYREAAPRFQFGMFECSFNHPYDTSITISKSDLDNLREAVAEADRRISTLNTSSNSCVVRWKGVAEKVLKLIG
jgi:hypothetical protein